MTWCNCNDRTSTFRFTCAEEFVAFFGRWYGPTLKAFEVLDEGCRAELAADLTDLPGGCDSDHGGRIAVPATCLEAIGTS